MNRGDVYAHQGLGRPGFVVIVSNDGFSAITGHPVVVRVSDRPDLTETPYVVALTSADHVNGHLESYSVVRLRRDRLGADPVGRVSASTLRKLDDALALLFDYGALEGSAMTSDDERDGVALTNLDQPLFDGADASKRDLVDYLDAVAGPIIAALAGRPLSVIRVLRGQAPFMQKNVPQYAPPWIRTISQRTQGSGRLVRYALCDDRRTLLWFANQRAVEYHPALASAERWDSPTHLVLDIDPPPGAGEFSLAVRASLVVRQALADAGLAGAVKTSGAKGLHVFVPLAGTAGTEDVAAATRALAARAERLDPGLTTTAFIITDREGKVFLDSTRAGGATVAAAYSPRLRPGVPVSFPVPWDELDRVVPADFTVHTVPALVTGGDPWAELMPGPQSLPADLITEGHAIPVARVQAMHEGKRRARARRG